MTRATGVATTAGDHVRHDLRRYVRLVVACALLGAVAVVPFSLSRTPTFSSSSRILVQRATADPLSETVLSADPARVLQTEALVVTGREVRRRVRSQLGREPAVVVAPIAQSDVLTVTATSSDPAEAALVANAYTTAYLDFRRANSTAELTSSRTRLNDQLAALDARLVGADRQRREDLARQRDALLGRLVDIEEELGTASSGVKILNRASVPVRKDRFVVARDVVLAALVAAAVGLLLALVRDRLVFGSARRTTTDLVDTRTRHP